MTLSWPISPQLFNSAGVGRTGTCIVIDAMLRQLNDLNSISVYDYLCYIRHQRCNLVQTEVVLRWPRPQHSQTAPPLAAMFNLIPPPRPPASPNRTSTCSFTTLSTTTCTAGTPKSTPDLLPTTARRYPAATISTVNRRCSQISLWSVNGGAWSVKEGRGQ